MKPLTIVIDFDGTCVSHEFPNVGKDIGAVPVLKALTNRGHKLILSTMRSNNGTLKIVSTKGIQDTGGDFLDDAVNWFKENDIPLYGIQTNPTQSNWTTSPKAFGDLYIDDAALGCPLIYQEHGRPYVNWHRVEYLLGEMGIL